MRRTTTVKSRRALGVVAAVIVSASVMSPASSHDLGSAVSAGNLAFNATDGNPVSGDDFGDLHPSAGMPACEYTRWIDTDGNLRQKIYPGEDDDCTPPTEGAPYAEHVSRYHKFPVNSTNQDYRAWAKARITNVVGSFRARLKIAGWDGGVSGTQVQECLGPESIITAGSSNFVLIRTDRCEMLSSVDVVEVSFRAASNAATDSGVAILDKLRLGRCTDGGDCSGVAPPSGW